MQYYSKKQPNGLTLIEVMLAMVLSLFVMLALARAFKLIGDRITYSQSELDLSEGLREITTRVRRELIDAKPILQTEPTSTAAREGYLVYYEGPFTNHTTSMIDNEKAQQRKQEDPDYQNTNYFPNSRYGDFDDYLAFTTESDDSLFLGYIPYGILAANQFTKLVLDFGITDIKFLKKTFFPSYDSKKAAELVPFYSNQAEIAYWVSPEWKTTASGILEYDTNGYPVFVDKDSNRLPDRLNLHRRVLLIRDDLNLSRVRMAQANGVSPGIGPQYNKSILPFLIPVGPEGLKVVPLSSDSKAENFYGLAGSPPTDEPGYWDNNDHDSDDRRTVVTPPWLIGLARVQQVMDLSLSRVTDDWSPPNGWKPLQPADDDVLAEEPIPWKAKFVDPTSSYGLPTSFLKANSMSGLQRPENRFAHVRVPEKLLSVAPPGTSPSGFKPPYGLGSSLPLLALCPPHQYITAYQNDFLATQADRDNNQDYGRFTMTGFLRPEFNLRDRFAIDIEGLPNSVVVRSIRGGTDIIASDITSFDIKIFDADAPTFVFYGDDGQPGKADFDDDQNGDKDNREEAGWINSEANKVVDDEVVLIDDINASDVFYQLPDPQNPPPPRFQKIGSGGFVDLAYPLLAGHPLGGIGIENLPDATANASDVVSQYSNLGGNFSFPNNLQKSGRFVVNQLPTNHRDYSLVNSFHQPTYDTWTHSYRTDDDFDQEGLINARFEQLPPGAPTAADKEEWLENNPPPEGHTGDWPETWPFTPKTIANYWKPRFNHDYAANNGATDPWNEHREDDRDGDPFVLDPTEGTSYRTGKKDKVSGQYKRRRQAVSYRNWSNMSVPEAGDGTWSDNGGLLFNRVPRGNDRIDVTAPLEDKLRGLQITIRLIDPNTGQMRQQTIMEDF